MLLKISSYASKCFSYSFTIHSPTLNQCLNLKLSKSILLFSILLSMAPSPASQVTTSPPLLLRPFPRNFHPSAASYLSCSFPSLNSQPLPASMLQCHCLALTSLSQHFSFPQLTDLSLVLSVSSCHTCRLK